MDLRRTSKSCWLLFLVFAFALNLAGQQPAPGTQTTVPDAPSQQAPAPSEGTVATFIGYATNYNIERAMLAPKRLP